jgi:hypothetical protein
MSGNVTRQEFYNQVIKLGGHDKLQPGTKILTVDREPGIARRMSDRDPTNEDYIVFGKTGRGFVVQPYNDWTAGLRTGEYFPGKFSNEILLEPQKKVSHDTQKVYERFKSWL